MLPVNLDLNPGDQAFLGIRGSPAEQTLLGRRRTKLDWKTGGPYTVLANDGPTILRVIDGLPKRINLDRIRPAPAGSDALPASRQEVAAPWRQNATHPIGTDPAEEGTQEHRPPRRRSVRIAGRRTADVSCQLPKNPVAGTKELSR